jgi:hypothetical protein
MCRAFKLLHQDSSWSKTGGWPVFYKKSLYKHNGCRCPSRASDGQRWKQRRAGKLEGIIVHVANAKKDKPAPADVVKTAAMLKGKVVPYFAAYRALNAESGISKDQARKGFHLIIPYLEKIRKTNRNQILGPTNLTTNRIFANPAT